MSGKKPNLLRNALKEMRVNEPVRLSKGAPSFKPPASDEKEAPPREVPQSEVPSLVVPQDEPAHSGVTQNEAAQTLVPQNEAPRIEEARSEKTQFESSRNKADQNEVAGAVAPQDEPPQIEAPEERVSDSAFFRLSHRVFSDPKLQKMSGDCFRLFLWMAAKAWRYPNSEGTVRASIRYIEEGTGMSHANVSRCLKTLKEMDLVRLAQTDFKRGNVWWVSPLACPSGGPNGGRGLPKKETPQIEVAQNCGGATSKSDRSSHKTRSEVPRFVGEIKKLRKEKIFKNPKALEVANVEKMGDGRDDSTDYELAVETFNATVAPNLRKLIAESFIEKELSHGFLPPSGVLQRLIAFDWYKNNRDERKEMMHRTA